jgi:hypothetical protein
MSLHLPEALRQRLDPLRERLHSAPNSVLPIIGSGLSLPALPSWGALLRQIIARAMGREHRAELDELLQTGRYLDVADALEVDPGAQVISQVIAETYQRPRAAPAPIYDLVAALPVTHVATTNYDPWLKDALARRLRTAPRVFTPEDRGAFTNIRPDAPPLVLMLHGDADTPDTCVLSQRAFRRLTHGAPAYRSGLAALASQRTLLFLGHSLTDPDLVTVLEEWIEVFGAARSAPSHVWLGAGIKPHARRRLLAMGVEPVLYGDDPLEHGLLADVLRYLAGKPGAAPDLTATPPARSDAPARPAAGSEAPQPAPVRHRVVRAVLQHLAHRRKMGVALMAPLGFDARAVVDEVMARLDRPSEPMLPVRLAPDLSSTTEVALYDKLLRDLDAGLRRSRGVAGLDAGWRAAMIERTRVQQAQRGIAEPGDAFALAIEDVVERLEASRNGTLLLLLDDLADMSEDQRRRWGFLMNRFRERLKLLVWGGHELYQLIVEPADVGDSSAFHHLERIDLGPLSEDEVELALTEELGQEEGQRLAPLARALTGGHPALVRDLLGLPRDCLRRAVAAELRGRLLGGPHVHRLRRELGRLGEVEAVLREFAAYEAPTWPREWDNPWAERLKWLGIVTEAEGGGWCWTAPLMKDLAHEVA